MNSPRFPHSGAAALRPADLLRASLAALGLALTLTSCAASGDRPACLRNEDCAADQRCQLGTCFDECGTDRECNTGDRCSGGLCIAAERCASNADCAFGTVCEDRYCVSQIAECVRDSECPPGQRCASGACVPGAGFECLTPSDCSEGERCVDNVCVDATPDTSAPDAGDDTGASDTDVTDTAPADVIDTAPDVVDPPDTGRRPCTLARECEIGELCIGGFCAVPGDTGPDVAPDVPDAPECLDFRDDCERASECCSGYCLGVAGDGTCSTTCSSYAQCNPPGSRDDWFCAEVPDGGTTVDICAPSDWARACDSASTCLGGICLRVPATSGCSWECDASTDCPPGTACGLVPFAGDVNLRVCVPIGSSCRNQNDCLSQTCLNDGEGTVGYCTALFCDARSPTACPPGWACTAPDPTQPGVTVCVLP